MHMDESTATDLMAQPGEMQKDEVKQFVCFKLANEEYAIDIHCVQEVIRIPAITKVPQMPDFCLGIINIRGNVNPVFDLRRLFKLEEKEFDNKTKILVANIGETTISMIVDEILENIKLEAGHIDPAPSIKMNIDRDCIHGIGELEGRMIVIMDLSRIHEHVLEAIGSCKVST